MGIYYYLLRESDRALFELGKCRPPDEWEAELTVPYVDKFMLPSHPDLVVLIADDYAAMGYAPEQTAEVARRMIAFAQGGLVSLRNDCSCEFEDSRDDDDRLRIVDSRYPADWKKTDDGAIVD